MRAFTIVAILVLSVGCARHAPKMSPQAKEQIIEQEYTHQRWLAWHLYFWGQHHRPTGQRCRHTKRRNDVWTQPGQSRRPPSHANVSRPPVDPPRSPSGPGQRGQVYQPAEPLGSHTRTNGAENRTRQTQEPPVRAGVPAVPSRGTARQDGRKLGRVDGHVPPVERRTQTHRTRKARSK